FMAEDVDREIREAAVIAIGLIGDADSAALLIDLLRRNGAEALKAIAALGKLGGDEARGFLSSLLKDDREISEIGGGRTSREDLRAAVIRALGQIGDSESIDNIKAFQAAQTSDQGQITKNTSLNQAITEVLGKR
ncbi:MAG: HEAT repeat domain-containing protein, partial [Candidatus Zixiibacteriota bacterium]